MSGENRPVLFTQIVIATIHIHIAVHQLEAVGVADRCPQEVVGKVRTAAFLQLKSPGVGILCQIRFTVHVGFQCVPFILRNTFNEIITFVRLKIGIETIDNVNIDDFAYQIFVHTHLLRKELQTFVFCVQSNVRCTEIITNLAYDEEIIDIRTLKFVRHR